MADDQGKSNKQIFGEWRAVQKHANVCTVGTLHEAWFKCGGCSVIIAEASWEGLSFAVEACIARAGDKGWQYGITKRQMFCPACLKEDVACLT